jgi:hypothetical protein
LEGEFPPVHFTSFHLTSPHFTSLHLSPALFRRHRHRTCLHSAFPPRLGRSCPVLSSSALALLATCTSLEGAIVGSPLRSFAIAAGCTGESLLPVLLCSTLLCSVLFCSSRTLNNSAGASDSESWNIIPLCRSPVAGTSKTPFSTPPRACGSDGRDRAFPILTPARSFPSTLAPALEPPTLTSSVILPAPLRNTATLNSLLLSRTSRGIHLIDPRARVLISPASSTTYLPTSTPPIANRAAEDESISIPSESIVTCLSDHSASRRKNGSSLLR